MRAFSNMTTLETAKSKFMADEQEGTSQGDDGDGYRKALQLILQNLEKGDCAPTYCS